MKISYEWLKRFIPFELSPTELGDIFTMSGSEVEAIAEKGFDASGIVTGRVISINPHPDADRLTVCSVDIGDETLTAVCGAPNVMPGANVVFAKIGAILANGSKLKQAKIRGVESFGMILAEDELGVSDDHSGIILLDESIKPGLTLNQILELKDFIFEFEITPNRPDCLSHLGMARELKALLGGQINYPEFDVIETGPKIADDLSIAIENPEGCPRYTGRLISGVKIGPSPLWLKARLYYLGIRPINNVVDITNYVLLETGHPLHAFDYRYFKSKKVLIRKAGQGEKFTTLDGTEHELNDSHCLITDGQDGVALAGIMGGLNSEVTDSTTDILLESAYFDPVTIRRGAKAVGLSTESSQRFERGADPEMAPKANNRACRLIAELAGGRIHRGMIDVYPRKFSPTKIQLRPARVNAVLGVSIEKTEIGRILNGLDINFTAGQTIEAEQPSFRPDLTREADLIEEIARVYGLDKITDIYRPGGTLEKEIQPTTIVKNRLRDFLVGRGFYEIFSLTLVDGRQLQKIDDKVDVISLMNPLSEEMSVLRPDLIISMLKALKHNINYGNKDIKLYEIGTAFRSASGDLADEKEYLCLGLSGREQPVNWRNKEVFTDFYSLKAELEAIFEYFKIGDVQLVPQGDPYFEEDYAFLAKVNNVRLGRLGKVAIRVGKTAGLKQESYVAELALDEFAKLAFKPNYFTVLPKFPASDRDIALLVDHAVFASDIMTLIRIVGGELVEDVFPFDIYKGKNIAVNKKSIAFRIIYRSEKNTLTDDEVDKVHNRVMKKITEEFKAELRA